MHIVTQLKLDQKQNPYWSSMLMHGTNCVMEVTSETFQPGKKGFKKQIWDLYERTFIRMAKETMKEGIAPYDLIKLFLMDEVRPGNSPQDRV